jgi:hypothetical protein
MPNSILGIHPLQNRVDPFGQLISTTARGAWMGNRGLIHNAAQQIVRPFKLKAWITCQIRFGDRHRVVMSPNRYTELFFLDEATAFSAGHRPCAECRRQDYNRFKMAWINGNPGFGFDPKTPVTKIDEIIHRERIDDRGKKLTHIERLETLPIGCFFEYNARPFVVKQPNLIAAWTAFGYEAPIRMASGIAVQVLTPSSLVNMVRAGYTPQMAN